MRNQDSRQSSCLLFVPIRLGTLRDREAFWPMDGTLSLVHASLLHLPILVSLLPNEAWRVMSWGSLGSRFGRLAVWVLTSEKPTEGKVMAKEAAIRNELLDVPHLAGGQVSFVLWKGGQVRARSPSSCKQASGP